VTFEPGEGLARTKLGPRNWFVVATLPFSVPEAARVPESERLALEEARRRAEEVRRQEEERLAKEKAAADAAAAAGAPGDGAGAPAAPAAEPLWLADLAAGVEAGKKDGRPVLVVFAAAAEAPAQAALDRALGSAPVKAALQRCACVRLPVDGDAGKPAKERLERIAAGAAAPFLAVLKAADESVLGTLAGADLKEEEAPAALARMLDAAAPPPVEAPKTSEPKPQDPGPEVPKPEEKNPEEPAPEKK
jgi:hypothetical protein